MSVRVCVCMCVCVSWQQASAAICDRIQLSTSQNWEPNKKWPVYGLLGPKMIKTIQNL